MNQIGPGLYAVEEVAAPKIYIGQVPGIDGKSLAGLGPSFVDQTTRMLVGASKKRAFENQLTTGSALDALPASFGFLLGNVVLPKRDKEQPPELVAELADPVCR